jgi:hypothetical protein
VKRCEVKPLIDLLVSDVGSHVSELLLQDVRLALETAFVAGVRSGLKFTSDAQFAVLFEGEAPATPKGPVRKC